MEKNLIQSEPAYDRRLGVQSLLFDFDREFSSMPQDDYERVVHRDEKGAEVITYEKVDYSEVIKKRPSVEMYDIDMMLKSGIKIEASIHTGNVSRSEGINDLQNMENQVNEMFNNLENKGE